MRVILRFSVDNEINGSLRNKLTRRLTKAGFALQKRTATYEHRTIDPDDMATVLETFWTTANNHRAIYGKPGRIDHFWLYSDRKRPPKISN